MNPRSGARLATRQIAGSCRGIVTSSLVGIAGAFIGFHLAGLAAMAGAVGGFMPLIIAASRSRMFPTSAT